VVDAGGVGVPAGEDGVGECRVGGEGGGEEGEETSEKGEEGHFGDGFVR